MNKICIELTKMEAVYMSAHAYEEFVNCIGSKCAFWRSRNNMWGWCGLAGAVGDDNLDLFLDSAEEADDETS